MSSSFPPPSEPPSLSAVLEELARLRTRVASDDRVAILDSIRRIDRDLRALDHAMRIQGGDTPPPSRAFG